MTASQSGGRQSCPECGLEFEGSGEVENHFFEQHLVAGGNTAERGDETGRTEGPGTTDAAPRASSETTDAARGSPGTTDEAGPSSERGTATESRPDMSRKPPGDGGTIRSRNIRRSDLFAVLFALVCVGGPVAALALAIT